MYVNVHTVYVRSSTKLWNYALCMYCVFHIIVVYNNHNRKRMKTEENIFCSEFNQQIFTSNQPQIIASNLELCTSYYLFTTVIRNVQFNASVIIMIKIISHSFTIVSLQM